MEVISSILFGLIVLLLILFLIETHERRKIGYKTGAKAKGDYIYPLIGNLPSFVGLSPEKAFLFLRNNARNFKESYRHWYFGNLLISAIRAREVEIILSSTKNIKKSFIYDFVHPFMGTGLLCSVGKKWQQRRRILTPAFHFNILQQFFGIFKEESTELLKVLDNEADKKEGINVSPLMARFALNIICETAMGVKLDTMANPDKYRETVHKIGVSLLYRLMRPWLHSDFFYSLVGQRQKFDKLARVVHSFTEKIIKQRRTMFLETKTEITSLAADENIYVTTKRRHAMLDTLLAAEANNEIDAAGIREEVDTFMFRGFDTSSTGMIFSLLLLGLDNEVQTKIYDEIKDVLADRDVTDLQIADISAMKYLDLALKECLRLYPPVAFISRELSEDWLWDKGIVPRESVVHIHIYDLHRDPEQFPDPKKFDPDRFLPENCEKRHPYAYVPFSAGPRNCIGQKFALLEMKTVIINILYKFRLVAVTKREEIDFVADLVLRAKTPIMVKFESR